METQVKKPEYARVEEDISQYLSHNKFGMDGRLPSMRKLSSEMNVSLATLRRAILNLEERGILETRHGSGVFITSQDRDQVVESEIIPSATGQPTVFLVDAFARGDFSLRVRKDYICSEFVGGAADTCMSRRYGLRRLSFAYNHGEEEALRRILRYKGKVCVLVATVHFLPYLEELEQHALPYVVLGPQGISNAKYEVRSDLFEGGAVVGKYLAKMGHRNVMHIATDPMLSKTTFERCSGFSFAFKNGCPSGQLVEVWAPSAPSMTEHENIFREVAAKALPKLSSVTAVFISSDQIASVAVPYFLQNGVRIPQNISLVTMDNSSVCRQFTPPWTSVDLNLAKVAKTGVELLASWENGQIRPSSINMMIQPELVVRESCLPINEG
jgi:DNA-binding LacI/PurR family transcriptional regulator